MGLFNFLPAGAAEVSDPEVSQYFETPEQKKGIFGFAPSRGVQTFIEDIGDALLTANGADPIHKQRRDAMAIGEILPMLDVPETRQEGLKRLFQIDPKTGLDVYGEMVKADKQAAAERLAQQRIDIAEGRASTAAKKTDLELEDLMRKRAAAQLRAGIPRNMVIASGQKNGFDLSDIPEDPKDLDKWVLGMGMTVKDQLAAEDRTSRTTTDREYKKGRLMTDTILRGGKLVADTTSKGANTQVSAGRLANPPSKGKKAASPSGGGGMIRINKTTGVVEYRQPDGTYKPKS